MKHVNYPFHYGRLQGMFENLENAARYEAGHALRAKVLEVIQMAKAVDAEVKQEHREVQQAIDAMGKETT